MLNVGLTGGMGAGKSTVARFLAQNGAVIIDSDTLARDVVAPGTDGIAAIVAAFGSEAVGADGALDRAAIARLVFGDAEARSRLEAIIHPRVRARARELTEAAPADAIVVQDVPLLAEVGLASTFDVVVVVTADMETRLQRLADRGVEREAATARIRAQAAEETRLKIADIVIDNSGDLADTESTVSRLWHDRLLVFEARKRRGEVVGLPGPVEVVEYDPEWPRRFDRLAARLRYLLGDDVQRIEHIGSTSVPGQAAKDVIDVQMTVTDLAVADVFAERLTAAGFPLIPIRHDTPKPFAPDRRDWEKRMHVGVDPADRSHIHVRREGSQGAYFATAMRDFLRAHPHERDQYTAVKRDIAARAHDVADYARIKEPWFDQVWKRVAPWAQASTLDGGRA